MGTDISFDKVVDKVFDSFKKVTPALVAVTIVTGMIIFMPVSVLKKMNLHTITNNTKTIIGWIFLVSFVLIITISLSVIYRKIICIYSNKRIRKSFRRKFTNLNKEQKCIIVQLMKSSDKVIRLESTSGNTIYLFKNGFIFRPEQVFSPGWDNELEYIYNPQPWLIDLYNKEPELFNI